MSPLGPLITPLPTFDPEHPPTPSAHSLLHPSLTLQPGLSRLTGSTQVCLGEGSYCFHLLSPRILNLVPISLGFTGSVFGENY